MRTSLERPMRRRRSPPYCPADLPDWLNDTTLGRAGNRCATGGSSPFATRSASIVGSIHVAECKVTMGAADSSHIQRYSFFRIIVTTAAQYAICLVFYAGSIPWSTGRDFSCQPRNSSVLTGGTQNIMVNIAVGPNHGKYRISRNQ